MSELLNMTERTNERIASLEAQIEELRLLMLKNMENDNSFLSEIVEPLPIGSGGGGGGGNPKPFEYRTRVEGEGESARTIHEIVNNHFFWDGIFNTLETFDCTSIISGGSVYLTGVRDNGQTAWDWQILTRERYPSKSYGQCVNYRLYTFNNGAVVMDYRDAMIIAGRECRWL